MFGLVAILACAEESSDARLRQSRRPSVPASAAGDTADADSARADSGGPPLDTGPEDENGAPAETGSSTPTQACYLGPGRDGAVCLAVVPYDPAWGEEYAYPDPYEGSDQYLPPARFVDLDAVDPALDLAPNFVVEEFMAAWKGRWGVLQPHTVEKVQAVRDDVGAPVAVNSGYRSPAYNAGVGGVAYSRHQYGDAADLDVEGISADDLADVCEAHGADYVATYETGHTHCDWRDAPLDPAFYDGADGRAAVRAERPRHAARLERAGPAWTAPAEGFDEGEPLRRWTAFDARGALLVTAEGRTFQPPVGARSVLVEIGRQLVLEAAVEP